MRAYETFREAFLTDLRNIPDIGILPDEMINTFVKCIMFLHKGRKMIKPADWQHAIEENGLNNYSKICVALEYKVPPRVRQTAFSEITKSHEEKVEIIRKYIRTKKKD